jgi:cytochrome c biogenesis protein CcmG, thiol:disulfide interchange protein DsbE
MKRLFFLIPIAVFAGLAVVFWAGLNNGSPTYVPSGMVGKAAPEMTLPPLDGDSTGFARAELGQGKPVIINFWASWCAPCRVEHPVLQSLADSGKVALYGIDYKDNPEAARKFLNELGNPFGDKINMDRQGRVSIDWGVTGVPETFVIGGDGMIRAHYAGPLSQEVLNNLILPALEAGGNAKD